MELIQNCYVNEHKFIGTFHNLKKLIVDDTFSLMHKFVQSNSNLIELTLHSKSDVQLWPHLAEELRQLKYLKIKYDQNSFGLYEFHPTHSFLSLEELHLCISPAACMYNFPKSLTFSKLKTVSLSSHASALHFRTFFDFILQQTSLKKLIAISNHHYFIKENHLLKLVEHGSLNEINFFNSDCRRVFSFLKENYLFIFIFISFRRADIINTN